jgi:hypothetical protein
VCALVAPDAAVPRRSTRTLGIKEKHVADNRNEVRQRQLERMETRFSGPEVNDQQNEVRERYLGHGVVWGATLGLAMGAGLGVALGDLAWGIGTGLSVGTGIGIALGTARSNKHAKPAAESSHKNGDGGV